MNTITCHLCYAPARYRACASHAPYCPQHAAEICAYVVLIPTEDVTLSTNVHSDAH